MLAHLAIRSTRYTVLSVCMHAVRCIIDCALMPLCHKHEYHSSYVAELLVTSCDIFDDDSTLASQ